MISVIVPCYNVEEYVEECLESILMQTYTNFEVICVNDGSTDNTLSILRDYEKMDNRIKVINQKNGGTADARNTGLNSMSNESVYVMFTDPDDFYIDKDAYKKLVNIMESNNVGMTSFAYYNEGMQAIIPSETPKERIKNIKDSIEDILYVCNVWTRIFKKDAIKELRYNADVKQMEDLVFMITFADTYNGNIYFATDLCLYHYRINTSGMTFKVSHNKSIGVLIGIILLKRLANNFSENDKKLIEHRITLIIDEIFPMLGIYKPALIKYFGEYLR